MTTLEVEANSSTYTIEVTMFYPGCDAVLNRAPENCTPAEDAEIEFEVLEQQLQCGCDDCDFDKDFIPEDDHDFVCDAIDKMQQYLVDQYEDGECG